MAQYFDYYEIGILAHGIDILIDPKRISFSMHDSIYNIYNTGTLTFNDIGGMFLERLTFMKGSPLEISYGITSSHVNKSKFVITDSYLEDVPDTPGIISGEITIEFKNAWYHNQEIKSRAYQDSISNIVKDIVTPLDSTNGTNIEQTEGTDIWYQPLINDAEFIDKILVPHAYSPSANETPFYAYYSNDGIFNLISGYKMFNKGITTTLNFPTRITFDSATPDKILNTKYLRNDISLERPLRNKAIFHITEKDGILEKTTDISSDHLPIEDKYFPAIADMSLETGYINQRRKETDVNKKNSELGYNNYMHRDDMFLQRFLVLLPLNPKLKSGQKVSINFLSGETNERDEDSKTFSGDYVIEDSEHIWNGQDSRGYTKLIVGRKYIRTGSTYPLKTRLAK